MVRTVAGDGSLGAIQVIDGITLVHSICHTPQPNTFWNWDEGFNKDHTDFLSSVVWIGDRYRIVWVKPVCGVPGQLWTADLDRTGNVIAGTKQMLTPQVDISANGFTRRNPPQIAHDPINNRSFVVFKHYQYQDIWGVLFGTGMTPQLYDVSAGNERGNLPHRSLLSRHPGLAAGLA